MRSFGIETYRGYRGRRKSKERHDAHRSPLVARPAANSIPYADTIYLKQRKKSISPLITLSYIQPRIKQNYPSPSRPVLFLFFPLSSSSSSFPFFFHSLSYVFKGEQARGRVIGATNGRGIYGVEFASCQCERYQKRVESPHREWFNEMHKYFCASKRKREIVRANERARERILGRRRINSCI